MTPDESAEILEKIHLLSVAKDNAGARLDLLKAELSEATKALRSGVAEARAEFKAADRELDHYLAGLRPAPLFDGGEVDPPTLTIEPRPHGGTPSSVTLDARHFDVAADVARKLRQRGA